MEKVISVSDRVGLLAYVWTTMRKYFLILPLDNICKSCGNRTVAEHGVDLSEEFLSGAHLYIANLLAANLLNANLCGTNLDSAILDNAILPDTVNKESRGNRIEQSIKSSSKRITKHTADGKPIVNQGE
jgi:hypothetical protein